MTSRPGLPARSRRLVAGILGMRVVNEAARRIGAMRGRGLVFVYHRVNPRQTSETELVPSIPVALLRRHVELLAEIGNIVPLEELLEHRDRKARARFSLTFDDDYVTHLDHALPVLRALQVPATFFLSGRSLRGLGAYWFELLEQLIRRRGLYDAARLLGVRASSPRALALACEGDQERQGLIRRMIPDSAHHLKKTDISALAAANMTLGFHTLHHPVLTQVSDDMLERALTEGRAELESVAGRPLRFFAYPHGKADARVARAVRAAGYAAAWTGQPRPIRAGDDHYLLGRWEPGPLATDDLLVRVAVRLNRSRYEAAVSKTSSRSVNHRA